MPGSQSDVIERIQRAIPGVTVEAIYGDLRLIYDGRQIVYIPDAEHTEQEIEQAISEARKSITYRKRAL